MQHKRPNILWIVIDSVRNYRSGGDDRDKLELMDKIAPESVEFKHVVTSAPSTVMSVSAMMTGLPSYYIARNYVDFKYDNSVFRPLKSILQEAGYSHYALHTFRDGREKLASVLDFADARYWPEGLTHLKRLNVQEKVDEGVYEDIHPHAWTNSDLNGVLENVLTRGVREPFFFYIHYNCRWDPDTSRTVEEGIDKFKQRGLYDHSVLIMCSDHGYPDPARGYTPGKIRRMGMTHDLLLTDDNIQVPLYFRFPGGSKVGSVETTVSTLDILPTILDMVGIDPAQQIPYPLKGWSLLPLIEGHPDDGWVGRRVRVDNRLLLQDRRMTAIRSDTYKYLYHHDTKQDQLYDLVHDPLERHNILEGPLTPETQRVLESFRLTFAEDEARAGEFQVKYILSKVKQHSSALTGSGKLRRTNEIALMGKCPATYMTMLLPIVRSAFPESHVTVLGEGSPAVVASHDDAGVKFMSLESHGDNAVAFNKELQGICKRADLWIVALESFRTDEAKQLIAKARSLKRKGLLIIDVNGERYVASSRKYLSNFIKILRGRTKVYLRSPTTGVREFIQLARGKGWASFTR